MELEKNYLKHVIEDMKDTVGKSRLNNNEIKNLIGKWYQDLMAGISKIKSELLYTISSFVQKKDSELLKCNAKISELNANIEGLKGNTRKLVDEGSQERSALNETLLLMTEQKKQLAQELETSRNNILNLTKELIGVRAQLNECKQKESSYDEAKIALNNKVSSLTQELNEINSQYDALKNKYDISKNATEKELDDLRMKCTHTEESLQVLTIELQTEREKNKKLEESLSSSSSSISSTDVENMIRDKMKETQEEFYKMQELLELSEQEKVILNGNLEKLSKELQKYAELNNKSQYNIEKLEKEKNDSKKEVTELRELLGKEKVKINELQKKIDTLEKKNVKLAEQLKDADNDTRKQEEIFRNEKCPSCEKYEMELKVLRDTVKAECTERAELLRTLGQYKRKIESLEGKQTIKASVFNSSPRHSVGNGKISISHTRYGGK